MVREQESKQKLLPIANNQRQIVDCSAVVAVLGDLEADKNAAAIYAGAVDQGFMTEEVKNGMVEQIKGAYRSNPQFARDEAIRNASLASMQLMLAAKAKGYDTCPMGGFDPGRLMEEFRVPDRYIPVMLITIGKAAQPAHASGRFPIERMLVKETF